MKVAWFSPFPPKQTGIALYSDSLVPYLRKFVEVDCYDFCNDHATDPRTRFADFARTGMIGDLSKYQALIYHVGNNPHFHLDILRMLRLRPGIVVLHDVVLYFLFAGLGRAGLIKHLWTVEGRDGVAAIDEITSSSPEHDLLRYPYPEKHPLTAALFPYANRIIVHNKWAGQRLIEMGYGGAVDVIPHYAFPEPETGVDEREIDALRRHYKIKPHQVVVGCFGFIGRTKRIEQACRALGMLKNKHEFRLLIVGGGDDAEPIIRAAGLEHVTIRTGFVEPSLFSRHLALTDIVLNLRYPSMGESSGTLVRAQALGKAVIVTRDAAFAELPDNSVWKIDIGPNEERDLAAAISSLIENPDRRRRLGESASRYAATALDPSLIARQFAGAIENDVRERARNDLSRQTASQEESDMVAAMMRSSLRRCLPPHLHESNV